MHKRALKNLINVAAVIIIVLVTIFTIVRLFYGAELSDEAYTVAETYMVSKGALPFVNNWSQMPGYTLLLAPFVRIYTAVVGGTDGIFLFFRFLTFFINLTTAVLVYFLLKDQVKNRILLALMSMIYLGASGWDYVAAFRGDRLAIDLLAIGILLIVKSLYKTDAGRLIPFISGILLALSVLSYPTLAVLFLFYSAAIGMICFKRRSFESLCFFLLGAVAAAVVVIGYLSASSSFISIFCGLKYILKDVTYFQLENSGIFKLSGYVKDMIKQMMVLALFTVMFFDCIVCVGYFFAKKRLYSSKSDTYTIKRIYIRRALFISFILGICLYHVYKIWIFKTGDNMYISLYAMTIETFAVPVVWLFVESKKRLCRYLICFVWLPTYIWVLATGLETYGDIIIRHTMLKNAAFLLGLFVCFATEDLFFSNNAVSEKWTDGGKKSSIFAEFIPVGLMFVITFSYLLNSYTYVYRDESIRKLDTTVPSGPYKGMRTTMTRSDDLVALEKVLGAYIDKDDYVLAMDNDPFIYLMTPGHICTPCTWDQSLYDYGFDEPDLYYDYFKVTGTEPTKIIYFNFGRKDVMSIDTEYKFNEYVNSYFHLIYEKRDIFEWSYVGKQSDCDLLIFERNKRTCGR